MNYELAVGLMSGTSIDGIDAALVRIYEDNSFELIDFFTQPFTSEQREYILGLCDPRTANVEEICWANMELGELFAQAVISLAERSGTELAQIDFVGSHGQTIYHIPGHSTLQIGEPSVIANRTGIVTVGDFRPADIALGGQGAPLVPYFDRITFGHLAPVGVQNIGGIGNVTVVTTESSALPAIAFDTGPGNMIIDGVVEIISEGKLKYDRNGELAAKGRVDGELLANLLAHPYFAEDPPKTTGREVFGKQFSQDLVKNCSLAPADLVATVTAFTAHSIADQYERFIFPYCSLNQVIVGGGGSYNPTLLSWLRELLQIPVVTHEDVGISGDAKEAIAFAFLAQATLRRQVNNVPEATGAQPGVLGKVCYPNANQLQV
ncbi:MAG: anhydro-N-acetylmuramic acid kinase [Firmicutes bacterium]|nr:anhydro-N-acetylmuramic acid kinase [Bacillota bacterium]